MKISKIIAAFSFLMIVAFSAGAQSNDKKRVRQGVRSGEITRTEMYKLGRQQRAIKRDVKEARADGEVTKCERKEIRSDKKKTRCYHLPVEA